MSRREINSSMPLSITNTEMLTESVKFTVHESKSMECNI